MILLDGHSLTAARAVPAVSMNLQLKERDGSATFVPASLDGIGVNSWMQDDREPEAGIVWRVRSIQQAFNTDTPQVTLEHIIAVLKDRIMFGEVTPKEITGNQGAETCTARQAIEYILSQQSDWTLGDFSEAYESVSNAYKFDGDALFDALESVTNTLDDALWTYDFTVYPFVINITAHSGSVDSEMRAGRNLKTISRTVDRSNMFTRFYPIGMNDLHVDGDYIEKNADVYGVICKTETDQNRATVEELTAWANEQLDMHAQPVVSIAVEGLELCAATGESLDSLTVGRVCRVPLPEFSTTIQERIADKNYPDKIGQPEVVKITLANSRNDVTKIIAEALKKSGRGGRGAARKDKDDHAWFEDTNDHVSMVATGIIGRDAHGDPNWTRLSEFIADGEGLHAKVETEMTGVKDRVATLEINESGIITEVQNLVSGLGSQVEQTATQIRSEVHAAESSLYSFVLQTASQIVVRVGEGSMIYSGPDKPQGTQQKPLVEGDMWVETTFQRTWSDAEQLDAWIDDETYDWSDLRGSRIYVYDAQLGEFREVLDEQVLAQDTDIEETADRISLVARAIKQVDGKVDVYRAELTVKADEIASSVNQRIDDLGSSVSQTASQIRSEVHAAQSQIYSSITQTASMIRSEVRNSLSSMGSSITQTASQIRSEVHAGESQIYSSITQTASQIRTEVRSTESSLRSSISQQADRISLVVQGTGSDATIKTASIVAGINNQDGSFVKIQAAKINLSGYVTANQLSSVNGRIDNLVSGNTQASAISTNRLYASNFQFGGKTIKREAATINGITYQILTWS